MTKPNNIADGVMQQIDEKHIKMKPKWYFSFITVLSLLGIVSLITALIYTTRLIAIGLTINFSNMPRYGARQQFEYLLVNFPWWSFVATVIFTIALIWVAKQRSDLYKIKTSQIATVIIASILIMGLIFSLTDTQHGLQKQQRGKNQHNSSQNNK